MRSYFGLSALLLALPVALQLVVTTAGCGSSPAGAAVSGGSTKCNGACVDTQSDSANCGACGHACPTGQGCTHGDCVADCGSACGAQACNGFTSAGGGCGTAPDCSMGCSACASTCTDLQNDSANCGACGHACTSSEYCNEGTCSAVCGAGLTCVANASPSGASLCLPVCE